MINLDQHSNPNRKLLAFLQFKKNYTIYPKEDVTKKEFCQILLTSEYKYTHFQNFPKFWISNLVLFYFFPPIYIFFLNINNNRLFKKTQKLFFKLYIQEAHTFQSSDKHMLMTVVLF